MKVSEAAPSVRLVAAMVLSACAMGVTACASAPRTVVPEGAPRKPDGVAIDRPSTAPPARGAAEASDGIVALVTPLGTDVARGVVQRFFNAITSEDRSTLSDLLDFGARSFNPTTGEEVDANYFWNRRFDTFDYTPLSSATIFRRDSVEVFRIDQWEKSAHGTTSSVVSASDVVARVRIPAISSSKPILGESIALQLRRSGSTYVIVRLTEDFSFQ
ncbi:MAG: hypothetical protein U0414_12345 [Polyangiaceae bacterium]